MQTLEDLKSSRKALATLLTFSGQVKLPADEATLSVSTNRLVTLATIVSPRSGTSKEDDLPLGMFAIRGPVKFHGLPAGNYVVRRIRRGNEYLAAIHGSGATEVILPFNKLVNDQGDPTSPTLSRSRCTSVTGIHHDSFCVGFYCQAFGQTWGHAVCFKMEVDDNLA